MSTHHPVSALPAASAPQCYGVWAPDAQGVRLHLAGQAGQAGQKSTVVDMEPDTQRRGWWVAKRSPVVGERYQFSVCRDGQWSQPLPDPRTRLQPLGVHGPSEVTATEFGWTDHAWTGVELSDQVIYELHVGTFSEAGTFAGVIEKLGYLRDLGVTVIELLPVQPFAGERNWGYDGVDWFAVHESYGGPTGLKELVDAAHAMGIAVFLDVVYNHFGPEGNYNQAFGPYLSAGTTGWGDVVNISDPGADGVRAYIFDAVRQWFGEFHIDGLRLDAVQTYDDRLAYSLMEEIGLLAQEYEHSTGVVRTVIAESEQNDPRLISDTASGGYGLDAHWLDDVHHCLHTLISGERQGYYCDYGTIALLADTLQHGYRFRNSYSEYRGRTHGRALDPAQHRPEQLITYTTTHDQTGNRAKGDRPSQNLTSAQLVLKAAIVLLSPYTPMLFMGEEFAARTPFPFFISHTDPALQTATRAGRLAEFSRLGWQADDVPDPNDAATFRSAKLQWNFDPEQQRIHDAYKTLLELRKTYRIAAGDFHSLEVSYAGDVLCMRDRVTEVVLVANFSERTNSAALSGDMVYSFGGARPLPDKQGIELDAWAFALLGS